MLTALMVSSSFLPGRGGIESYLAELCEELAPHLAVLAPGRRDGKLIPSDLCYPTTGYPGNMLYPSARIAREVVGDAAKHGTKRVLFGTPWPLALLGPRLMRAGLSYSVIVHGAELLVPSVIPVVNQRLATALSEADLLLAVSEYTRAKLRSFLEKRKKRVPPIEILRARVDLDRFHPNLESADVKVALGLKGDQPMVLAFGRLVRRKGIDKLIRAMDRVALKVPGTALVVAGSGPELRRLQKLAAKVTAPVVFAGRVSEADAPALYATADAFVLPVSDRWFGLDVEGLGVVLLEASASGTVAITGRSGGTPEAIVDGETGFVVDAGDEQELVDRLTEMLENPDLASRMGLAGRDFVAREFSRRPLPRPLLDWLGIDHGQPSSEG